MLIVLFVIGVIKLFTLVYGCGPSTADKWYNEGLRTIEDVKKCNTITLTETQKLGMCVCVCV